MNNPVIIDILLCALLIGAAVMGYKRGLFKALWGIISTLAAIVLTIIVQHYLPPSVSGALSSVISFAAIRVMLSFIYSILNTVLKLPLLKQTNGLAGAVIYLLAAVLCCYITFALIDAAGITIPEGTVICKYFREYNLWSVIMGLNSSIGY